MPGKQVTICKQFNFLFTPYSEMGEVLSMRFMFIQGYPQIHINININIKKSSTS